MAIDAALLDIADQSPSLPLVRLYRWAVPTVTVGYFQVDGAGESDAAWASCPRVRRLTGGGAILHHHEITYSCVLPRTHCFRDSPLRLYEVMHVTIRELLAENGVEVGFRAELPLIDSPCAGAEEPFLCFRRADPRDLAMADSGQRPKVVGSAQRRRRGTILQHGSILLKASPLLPEVPGIADSHPAFDEPNFVGQLPSRLGQAVADTAIPSEYTEKELHLAFQYEHEKSPVSLAQGASAAGDWVVQGDE